ncbi:MAG: hypothetical protein IMF15_08540 [Proteobacteria bacterium]|nr:hypothetical protein [Pseudomonadota bacterium]
MLSDDELGAFILVLANSHQDAFLQNELQTDLESTFIALKDNHKTGKLKAPKDDIDVFEKLLKLDLDDIPVWQYKTIGDWEIVYNSMRQMRPARSSSQILSSIKQWFDETRFHFNKSFLKPEILWEGVYKDIKLRVLFNKFPFSDYHLLIVLSPEKNSSQLLTQKTHQYVFSLVDEMREIFPGLGIGYNSLAAGASVNHFHFQGFIRQQKFAIEKDHWQQNGGDKEYPLEVKRFADAESSWEYLDQLTESDKAFNCLYLNNYCYVIPRKYQGTVDLPEWLDGAGWIDMAGSVTVSDAETFSLIDERSVAEALGLLSDD